LIWKTENISGRPAVVDDDQILTLIENNPYHTTRETSDTKILYISHVSVIRHLKTLGYINHYDVWVPHNLTKKSLMDRISICDSLLKRNENDPFFKRIITDNKKWIVYINVERKKFWRKRYELPLITPKVGLHSKKVVLCVWWDWKGIVYYELLPHNQTINSDKYCSQLDRLKAATDEKRPELATRKGVVFHQEDNASCLVAYLVKNGAIWLGCPTSPTIFTDLAPSDYHLFRSLQNSLNRKNFDSLKT